MTNDSLFEMDHVSGPAADLRHARGRGRGARAVASLLVASACCGAMGCGAGVRETGPTTPSSTKSQAKIRSATQSTGPFETVDEKNASLDTPPPPPMYAVAKRLYLLGLVSAGVSACTALVFTGIDAWKWSQATPPGGWNSCYDGTGSAHDCALARTYQNDAQLWQMNTIWMFVGGMSLATISYGIGSIIWPPPPDKKKPGVNVRALPLAGPTGGGAGLTITF